MTALQVYRSNSVYVCLHCQLSDFKYLVIPFTIHATARTFLIQMTYVPTEAGGLTSGIVSNFYP